MSKSSSGTQIWWLYRLLRTKLCYEQNSCFEQKWKNLRNFLFQVNIFPYEYIIWMTMNQLCCILWLFFFCILLKVIAVFLNIAYVGPTFVESQTVLYYHRIVWFWNYNCSCYELICAKVCYMYMAYYGSLQIQEIIGKHWLYDVLDHYEWWNLSAKLYYNRCQNGIYCAKSIMLTSHKLGL